MGKKEQKEKKDKPLERMTAKELRELGLSLGGIVGVHGMNKNELIDAIREMKGIVVEKTMTKSVDVRVLKEKIRALKEKKAQAKEAGDNKKIDIWRRRISNLKKQTRRKA